MHSVFCLNAKLKNKFLSSNLKTKKGDVPPPKLSTKVYTGFSLFLSKNQLFVR